TENKDLAFHQVHDGCGGRVKYKRVCEQDGVELSSDQIGRAYEYAKNDLVMIEDGDLEGLPVPSKHTIDLTTFVSVSDVDRVYTEKAYFLEPEAVGAKPYRLLAEAFATKNVMGIGKIAIRSKERLCTIRARDGVLVLET